jgi:hypothetical protein
MMRRFWSYRGFNSWLGTLKWQHCSKLELWSRVSHHIIMQLSVCDLSSWQPFNVVICDTSAHHFSFKTISLYLSGKGSRTWFFCQTQSSTWCGKSRVCAPLLVIGILSSLLQYWSVYNAPVCVCPSISLQGTRSDLLIGQTVIPAVCLLLSNNLPVIRNRHRNLNYKGKLVKVLSGKKKFQSDTLSAFT